MTMNHVAKSTQAVPAMILLVVLSCVNYGQTIPHRKLSRLAIQFVGYSSELWRGKRVETAIHIACSLLWAYVATVFFVAARAVG